MRNIIPLTALFIWGGLGVAGQWPTDFDSARKTANKTGKPMLVYVYDSV